MTKIKTKSAFLLTLASLLGVVVLGGVSVNIADRLYSVFLLVVVGVVFALLAAFISAKNPQKSLFQILDDRFSSFAGQIFKMIFVMSALVVAATILFETTRFFSGTILRHTPPIIISLFIAAIAAYLAKSRAPTLAKWAILALFGSILTLIFVTIFTLNSMEFENLNFSRTVNFNLDGQSFLLLIPLVIPMILAISGSNHEETKPYKSIFLASLAAFAMIFFILLRDALILGTIIEEMPFPSHTVARLSRHATGIDISPIVAVIFAALPVGLISLSLLTLHEGSAKFTMQKTGSKLILPMFAVLALVLSQLLFLRDFKNILIAVLSVLVVLNFLSLCTIALFCKKE